MHLSSLGNLLISIDLSFRLEGPLSVISGINLECVTRLCLHVVKCGLGLVGLEAVLQVEPVRGTECCGKRDDHEGIVEKSHHHEEYHDEEEGKDTGVDQPLSDVPEVIALWSSHELLAIISCAGVASGLWEFFLQGLVIRRRV